MKFENSERAERQMKWRSGLVMWMDGEPAPRWDAGDVGMRSVGVAFPLGGATTHGYQPPPLRGEEVVSREW